MSGWTRNFSHRAAFLVVALVLMGLWSAVAQGTPGTLPTGSFTPDLPETSPTPSPTPEPGTIVPGLGGVRGSLVWRNRDSGQVMADAGARVWLFPYSATRRYGIGELGPVAQGQVAGLPGFHYTVADANGCFCFTDVEPGQYYLFAASAYSTRNIAGDDSLDPNVNEFNPLKQILRQQYLAGGDDSTQLAAGMFQVSKGVFSPLEVERGQWSEFKHDFGNPGF